MERIYIKCHELGFIVISAPEPGFGVYIFTFPIIEIHLHIHTPVFFSVQDPFKYLIDLNHEESEPNCYTQVTKTENSDT